MYKKADIDVFVLFVYRLNTGLVSKWRTLLSWTNHGAISPVRGRCPMFPLVCQISTLLKMERLILLSYRSVKYDAGASSELA